MTFFCWRVHDVFQAAVMVVFHMSTISTHNLFISLQLKISPFIICADDESDMGDGDGTPSIRTHDKFLWNAKLIFAEWQMENICARVHAFAQVLKSMVYWNGTAWRHMGCCETSYEIFHESKWRIDVMIIMNRKLNKWFPFSLITK